MTAYEILRLVVWVIGLPIIVFLVWCIIRRVREIDRLDAVLREEEEQMAKNPYAAYARILEAERLLEEARGRGRKKADQPSSRQR